MNYRAKYLMRRIFRQADRFTLLNLTPIIIYVIGMILLVIGFMTLEDDIMVRLLYSVVGYSVWLF